ncbi:MAG: hypothetical protein KF819_32805 [Labilithrix sp.]|nr:hypothetical protein [Labilithrix sp.]
MDDSISSARRRSILTFSLVALAIGLAACSGDEAAPGDDAGAAPPQEGGLPAEGGPTDPGATDGGVDAPSNDAQAGGRGINVTVNGTTHALTNAARAAVGGNGYSIQANKIEGTQMTGFTILMVKALSNGGAPDYVEPTPNTYACSSSVPTPPYFWSRLQYTGAEGIYQYGSGATCVTLTKFGAVGEPVAGTFQSTLDRVTGSGPSTVTVSGSFDVDRQN